jgi:hypothetical protein
VAIPGCDVTTAIQAFRRGLHRDSDLYKELTMHPCLTFEQVQSRAKAAMRLEEDQAYQKSIPSGGKVEKKEKREERSRPYTRTVSKVEASTRKEESKFLPKLNDYGFTVGMTGLLQALKELGDKVRWPKPPVEGQAWRKDSKHRCDFHGDIGHATEDCYTLRREIQRQYNLGNLNHLLLRGGKQQDKVGSTSQARPADPPICTRTVNVITGGSDLSGLTYSAAKRHATETKGDKPEISCRVTQSTLPSITFDEVDVRDKQEHHDALIITMSMANCKVKKILVDTGSSVNLIMLQTVRNMGFDDSDIQKRSVPLVGFSGETAHSIGEIVVPTFAGGVNKQVKFLVIDAPATYNVILGRPWLHQMKAVASTYHQCLKFPTPWGVEEIRGDQEEARGCYKQALKTTSSPPA